MEIQEYLGDFKFRCHEIVIRDGDIEEVRKGINTGKCPFVGFEINAEFRRMRKYYRKLINNGLRNDLLRIIQEVENEYR
jgi:hypothetical protein